MRTLVVGDIHGCADELARLVATAQADCYLSVGDLFTKGPDPVGVWQILQASGFQAVLGNHDDRLLASLAGQRPGDRGARRCIDRLDAAAPGWQAWVRALPLWREVSGFTMVHASLHTSGDLHRTTRDDALMRRRIPDTRDGVRWTDLYEGARRVIYGHDAVRGLYRRERDGLPWLIGLDSGCVYGRSLTGYLIEEDRLIEVPAARAYKSLDS